MKSIICIYQEPCLVSHHWPSCVCSLLTSLASLLSSVICPWPDVRRCDGCCAEEGGSHTSEECWQCPEVSEAPATSQPQLQPDLPSLDQEAGWGHSDWDISRTIHDDALSSHCCPPHDCPLLPSPGQQLYNNQWSFYWCFTFIFIMVVFSKVLIVI